MTNNGFVLVDKPQGLTSHDVVGRLRRLYGERRIGHAGTLDPMATGLLIAAVGPATRLLRFAQAETKLYSGTVKLGVATDSLDADGSAIGEAEVPHLDEEALATLAQSFVGTQAQVPPMVSAIQQGGRRLYELAREGVEVERAARTITVDEFHLTPGSGPQTWDFRVRCSTGTYVRVLLSDAAQRAGTVGHLVALRREASGAFRVDDAETLESIASAQADGRATLRNPLELVRGLPQIELTDEIEDRMYFGQRVPWPASEVAEVALRRGTRLLGIGRVADGLLRPELMLPREPS